MVKYQKRKSKENWMTVETSTNHAPNIVSNTMDRLERSFKNCQLRAIDDRNQLLETR